MKKLYQTLTPLLKTRPQIKPEFKMIECPDFLMKPALDKTPASAENQLCYMDAYQHQQMNVLNQIKINGESSHHECILYKSNS